MKPTKLKDIVYQEYERITNMSLSELKKWKNNPLSKKGSASKKQITLAIRLKATPKGKWTSKHYKGAIRAIRYIKRSKKIIKNRVALRNLGYNIKKKK